MTHREAFLQTFEAELILPRRLSGSYEPDHCLCCRDDHTLWQLRRKADGEPVILLTGSDGDRLRAQFSMLVQVQRAIPGQAPIPLDCFEEGGTTYLLRSWLPGQDLVQLRAAQGGCSQEQCVRIGRELCGILQALHSLEPPIIHRDLKPENVILDDRGRVRLLDFGIARTYRRGAAHDTSFMGTEATAAPEQYGYAQTDPRTDIYGLGMTLLYLLTGDYDRAALSHASPRFRAAILKATDFAPDRRFASVGDFASALQERSPLPALKTILASVLTVALVGTIAVQQVLLHQATDQRDEALDRLTVLEQEARQRNRPVAFSSLDMEQAVRRELKLPQGDLTTEDLALVRELTLERCNETDLQFLQQLPRLHTLWIRDYPAKNLEPLDLPNLNMVTFERGLQDLTGAAQLTYLETFSMIDCPAQDLSPLEDLEHLISINLDGPTVDYSQLNDLSRLVYVRVPAAYHDLVRDACPAHTWELLS